MCIKYSIAILAVLTLYSSNLFANWSLNIGYNNPPGATIGINFLKTFSKNLGFEVGIGWVHIKASDDDDDNNSSSNQNDNDKDDSTKLAVAGDVNLKYFFSSGTVKPYLQGGFGVGVGASLGDDTDAGAGVGGGFGGLGLMIGGQSFYVYGSLNLASGGTFLQGGVGFDI